ncbi:uncharacterized protein [Nicotiana tomentosiformis]|uniref:uncharacterized protein n=1 Tax=Nicotiana tomentosiformis TaxID=4098 RepID=UPI00388C67D3
MGSLTYLSVAERPLAIDVLALANRFERLDVSKPSWVLSCIVVQSSLLERFKARQFDYAHLLVLKDTVQWGDTKEVVIGDDGVMQFQGQICVPNVDGLRDFILEQTHNSRYFIYTCVTKMHHDLKQHYWWRRMKKDIVVYVSRC